MQYRDKIENVGKEVNVIIGYVRFAEYLNRRVTFDLFHTVKVSFFFFVKCALRTKCQGT